ncbi:MAG: hypothetical protein CVV64_00520 [Candidatus Wallbacteria bacterium HGW-Wallbacteria-1]|jgi:hypothetical protein|uniref:Glycosyltransferase RgtA/B/C/D-like domain-containing protein n=1 Tax=Candidatus Wallbacteria bacterium HGW-Wallbacteria-1 TaxID=2013854 RepID=A0A2N1PUB4_9BACT|nr:MAG: hypothetical protein CVV64_00520 [Candidatus Wallbacteria bacterium HGW-Wallbacteria-1]
MSEQNLKNGTAINVDSAKSSIRAGFLIILLLTIVTRLWVAGAGDLIYDEAFMFDGASRPHMSGMLDYLGEVEFHPPLSYIFLHWWIPIAGKSEFLLRLLPAGFNILTVFMAALMMAFLWGPGPAFLTGVLMVFSPYQLQYGCELRMYSQLQFFTLAGAYCGWRWLRPFAEIPPDGTFSAENPTSATIPPVSSHPVRDCLAGAVDSSRSGLSWLFAAWVAFVLGLYSHYYAFFALLATALWVLLQKHADTGRFSTALKWGGALLIVPLLCFIPWISEAMRAAADKWPSVMPAFDLLSIPDFIRKMVSGNFYVQTWDFLFAKLAVFTLLLGGCGAIVSGIRKSSGTGRGEYGGIVAVHLAVPLIGQYLFALKFGTFIPKYAISSAPFAVMLTVGGIWYLSKPLLSFFSTHSEVESESDKEILGKPFVSVALITLLLLSAQWPFFRTQMEYFRTNWTQVGKWLSSEFKDGDLCLVSLPGRTVNLSFYAPSVKRVQGVLAESFVRECDAVVASASRIWLVLVQSEVKDPQGTIQTALDSRMVRKLDSVARDNSGLSVQVILYTKEKKEAVVLPKSEIKIEDSK